MLELLQIEADTDYDAKGMGLYQLDMQYSERLRELVPFYQPWILGGAEVTPRIWTHMQDIARQSGSELMMELFEYWKKNTLKTSLNLVQLQAVAGSALIKMRRELMLSGDVSGFLTQIDDPEKRLAGLLYCALSNACSRALSVDEHKPRHAYPN